MSVLRERALVLNKSWIPISTITIRGALILLFRDKANVICHETFNVYDIEKWVEMSDGNENGIRSANICLAKPEVILLKDFARVPNRNLAFTRKNLYRRDEFTCQYCYKKMPQGKLTIDHIIPRSKGGKSTWENCVLACIACNSKKGSKSLSQINFVLKKTPRKPTWSPIAEVAGINVPDSWKKFLPK